MNTLPKRSFRPAAARRAASLGLFAITLSACVMNAGANPSAGIDFRQARYAEVTRIDSFQECREEALLMDRQARARGDSGAYITSAVIMEKCETGLEGSPRGVALDDRMRLAALATVNYLKGGDAEKARRSLSGFKRTFPEKDIYFADGASFIATAELLLGRPKSIGFGEFATMNVNRDVKNEMRRLAHWKGR
jgi:hypothetical protein